MKQLLISFLSLVIVLTTPTFGQVDSVTDQYMGNGNLLVNPGLESGLKSWTNVAGVLSVESSVVIKGKRAGKVVLSSQALNLYQDVTSYQAQLADGVQGLASIRVKTSVSGLRVCPRQAGLINSNLCVSVVANNKWGLYKVPFTLGGTSNGISINSNGTSISGTVYFDDSFMGPQELGSEIDASKLAGESYFASGGSFTGAGVYSTASGSRAPTIVVQNEGSWQTSSLAGYQQTINNLSPGCYSYTWTFGVGGSNIGANQYFTGAINGVNQLGSQTYFTQGSGMGSGMSVKGSHCITSSQNITYELKGTSTAGSVTVNNAVVNFNLLKFSSDSTYASTNADTDWVSCTPSSSQGFGTPTFAVQCKRQGSDLLMKGRFTPSATTAVEARLGLPVWNGVQLVSAGSSKITTLEVANGFYVRAVSANAHGGAVLIEPSVSYITFGPADTFNTTAAVALSKANANNIASTDTLSFNARIPIEGWENSNLIIAQLSGLEKCENTLSCTDTFSAKISSVGVVSGENLDWLDGNCSNPTTGTYNCTIKTGIFTAIPNCTATAEGAVGGPNTAMLNITSATALSAYLRNTSNGVQSSTWNLICQKQGVDFVSKTAKAVASDQNTRVPGILKSVITRVDYGGSTFGSNCNSSPCSFYNQRGGSWITSMTRSALGDYSVTLNTSYWANIAQTRCWITGGGSVHWYAISNPNSSGIFSVGVRTNIGTYQAVDSTATLYCEGEQQ